MNTHKTDLLGLFKEEGCYEWRLHSAASRYGNDIYFFPDRAKGIYKVNIYTYEKEYIPLEIKDDARFANGFLLDEYAYCIQVRPKSRIISVNLNTYKQKEIDVSGLPDQSYLQRDYCISNNKIFLTDRTEPILITIDCEKQEGKAEQVISKDKMSTGFGTVCKMDDEFYFSSQKGIIIWNSQTKRNRWIKEFPREFGMIYRDANGDVKHVLGTGNLENLNEQPFSSSFHKDGKVYFLPGRTNMSIILDADSGLIVGCGMEDETESADTLIQDSRITHDHYRTSLNEGKYYFFSTCTNRIYSEDSFLEGRWIMMGENDPAWLYASGQALIAESKQSKLDDFLEYLV